MTARRIWAQVVDIAACAAIPVAVWLVAIATAVSVEADRWLTLPVLFGGAAVALAAGVARALWYRRGGAR